MKRRHIATIFFILMIIGIPIIIASYQFPVAKAIARYRNIVLDVFYRRLKS